MFKYVVTLIISLYLIGCGGSQIVESKIYDNNNEENTQNMEAQNASHRIPPISDSDKQEFLDAINSARADTQDCGEHGIFPPAPALTWNDELYKAAYEHTRDMALSRTVEHDGTNSQNDWTSKELNLGRGSHFYERIENNGYKEYKTIEENVAGGTYFDNPQDVVQAWINSPGHCANLMNKDVTEVGMAHVQADTKYTHYWSQEFGARHQK